MARLAVTNLCKSYDGKFNALDDVNFEIEGNGLYLITGENGSGKSTLFNLIAGLDMPDSGHVLFNGVDVKNMKGHELNRYRRDSISYIFQDFNLIGEMSLYDNLAIALGRTDDFKIDDVLKKVDMLEFKNKPTSELSGGQKQRVAIARAFIKESSLVLADEVTALLDSEISVNIVKLLKELSKTKCVLAITHNRELFDGFADGEIYLSKGRIEKNTIVCQKKSMSVLKNSNNGITYKPLLNFARVNFKTRKAKKIYLLLFSIIMLMTTMVSMSAMSVGYNTVVAKLLDNSDHRYISCVLSNDNLTIPSMKDNNYVAVTGIEYKAPDNLFWLPMNYGRSENVLEINDNFKNTTSVLGNFPQNNTEIVITDYFAQYLIEASDNKFKTTADILSNAKITLTFMKESFSLKVVGIMETDYSKFLSLKNIDKNELSYFIDNSYYKNSLRWKLKEMAQNSNTSVDRNFYFYCANAMTYYNVFYVCEDFEKNNLENFIRFNLSDQNGMENNMPSFYSLNKIENLSMTIYKMTNSNSNGIIVPLSQIVTSAKLDDLYSVLGDKSKVFNEVSKMSIKDVTVDFRELFLLPLTSKDPEKIVYRKTFVVSGFYDDYFDTDNSKAYYLSNEDFNEYVSALKSYQPSTISLYVDKNAISDNILSSVLGEYVPNGNMVFPEKQIADDGFSKLKIVQAVFIVLFILMLILSIIFIVQIIVDDIKENEKNYAILKTLGLSNLQLIVLSSITTIIILSCSIILAILLSFVSIAALNIWLVNGFLKVAIVHVNWFGIIAVIGISTISLIIGMLIGLYRLIKKPPINILKQIR